MREPSLFVTARCKQRLGIKHLVGQQQPCESAAAPPAHGAAAKRTQASIPIVSARFVSASFRGKNLMQESWIIFAAAVASAYLALALRVFSRCAR